MHTVLALIVCFSSQVKSSQHDCRPFRPFTLQVTDDRQVRNEMMTVEDNLTWTMMMMMLIMIMMMIMNLPFAVHIRHQTVLKSKKVHRKGKPEYEENRITVLLPA